MQKSVYSKLAGVPVALIGLIGYMLILGSLLAPEEERGRFATVALTLGGFGFSAYLTYREVFSLQEICEYCVASAILMTIMMGLSIVAIPAWRRRARPGQPSRPPRAARSAPHARLSRAPGDRRERARRRRSPARPQLAPGIGGRRPRPRLSVHSRMGRPVG